MSEKIKNEKLEKSVSNKAIVSLTVIKKYCRLYSNILN